MRELLSSFEDLLAQIEERAPPGVALAFGAACALLLLAWAVGTTLKTYRPYLPRYAHAAPLVAQGWSGGTRSGTFGTDYGSRPRARGAPRYPDRDAGRPPGHGREAGPERLIEEARERGLLSQEQAASAHWLRKSSPAGRMRWRAIQRLSFPAPRLRELGGEDPGTLQPNRPAYAARKPRMPGSTDR